MFGTATLAIIHKKTVCKLRCRKQCTINVSVATFVGKRKIFTANDHTKYSKTPVPASANTCFICVTNEETFRTSHRHGKSDLIAQNAKAAKKRCRLKPLPPNQFPFLGQRLEWKTPGGGVQVCPPSLAWRITSSLFCSALFSTLGRFVLLKPSSNALFFNCPN